MSHHQPLPPTTPRTPRPRTTSLRPASGASPNPTAGKLNLPLLARICDDIRAAIRAAIDSYTSPSAWPHVAELSGLIAAFIADEDHPSVRVALDTIRACRLDKLLEDILNPRNHPKRDPPAGFDELVAKAAELRERWLRRFAEGYFGLDDARCLELVQTGGLRDVVMSVREGRPEWKVRRTDSSAGDPGDGNGNSTSLDPGEWFLNMACAYRNRMVGSSVQTLATFNGTKILPLLEGKEEDVGPNTVKYTRHGTASQMVPSVLSSVGMRVHVLRGHELRSRYAPKAGIRYDGMYIVRSFGMKLDPRTETYHMSITMEYAPGQEPLSNIQSIPTPAQQDEWKLYQGLEKTEVRRASEQSEAEDFETWNMRQDGEENVVRFQE